MPDGTVEFFKRRLSEAGGLALIAATLALAAALITFSPSDPSFNTATDSPAENLLGTVGAVAADGL
ncbi:MAG: DNA translocase FtsK 4TM domain-containing protein, partial [Rhodospirillales bacterium]